ncbi:AAA domain-containing protein [Dyella sp. M7H15-1]|uniref:AAA domain-containing protein n=1 Tax=Dyella sp. M7H15-1 TaxID=2501295 RepID=UPI001F0C4DC1|nr:AAA domain-containing protein [Dyella sp. M7H15-1]
MFAGLPMDWDTLDAEREIVRALMGDAAQTAKLRWRVVVRSSHIKKSREKDALEAAADYLNSFYLDDLDRLIKQADQQRPFGSALTRYLGEAIHPQGRVDILTTHTSMAELVSAQHLPSARWAAPSKYPLVLAQQAAVAYVLRTLQQGSGMIGINGPPGTGKTTLLCDVIAEIVTERARRIAALDRPVSLFDEAITLAGKRFTPLKASVMEGTAIVVTSNNNNAVKNITQELPARAKISHDEFPSAAYFEEVIREVFHYQKVFDDEKQPVDGKKQPIDAWGLIAAALGNVGNRRSFAAGFFRDEYAAKPAPEQTESSGEADDVDADADIEATHDPVAINAGDQEPPSMKQLLEAATNEYRRYQDEWLQAKRSFLDLYAEWECQRDVLIQAENAARELDRSQAQLDQLQADCQAADKAAASQERALTACRERQADQRTLVQANQAALAHCQATHLPNLWDRLMQWLGQETPRMATRRHALEAPTRTLHEASALLATLAREAVEVEAALRREREKQQTASRDLATLQRQRQMHQQAVDAGFAAGAKHFPNTAFASLPTELRHRASIAVHPALDQLRAKLFLQAVELHRVSILANAGKFIGNLWVVNGMLTNGLQDKLPLDQRHWLWNVFFFVVPVVSTTLASFDRLFAGMEQDSLGWLLIDEAGQATPQSAAGAIWRSRRAVIVGDPLQIEPVFTVPLRLTEQLRRQHEVDPIWSPADESVQTLADRITPFGSWVEQAADCDDDASRIWTGMPLRTHRRCDDPMFSVANRIAYADQMVHGNVDEAGVPKPTLFFSVLGESAWFQVASTRVRHPVSQDEFDVLRQCLADLRREPARLVNDSGKPVRTYVISPFRKVKNACQKVVNDGAFKGVECGTVHTFQGKEAEIVFLVLGTAPGAQGVGAREWAKSKPNLLNVAITRAKYRLYVIGDAQQWGGLTYFRALHAALTC